MCLERGAEVDRETNDGETALFAACKEGETDAASLLLARGADVEHADEDGYTALYCACRSGDPVLARMCLERGAEVDRVARAAPHTPLYIACRNGHRRGAAVHRSRRRR